MSNRNKSELRRDMRRVLSNLDRRWLHVASREICREVARLLDTQTEQPIEHVLAWVSFFPGEVDLSPLIDGQLDKRKMYLPQVHGDSMHFISIGREWLGSMTEGDLGIPEPSDATGDSFDIANASRTAILVPGLAFDEQGTRLGRGKGFYDKFLGRSALHAITKVGVCWSLQMMPAMHAESHDVAMDWIVTEKKRYSMLGEPVT